jgi:chromosome segregation ATPase
LEEAQKNKIC